LTAIDYFIIFAVIAVLAASGIRLYKNNNKPAPTPPPEEDEYIVSFVAKGMNQSATDFLEKGDIFYLTGGKKEFGVLEDFQVNPAKIQHELDNGTLIKDLRAIDNDEYTKADVTGTFKVKGTRNANNHFYVSSGALYVAPNLEVTIFSREMSLKFIVTDIEKVS